MNFKEIKVNLKLYSYEELKEDAKEKAFNEHETFLYSVEEDFNMNNLNSKELKEYVEDSILCNEYLFFSNGKLANCTTYTGKHEKTGITELNFHGKTYTLK